MLRRRLFQVEVEVDNASPYAADSEEMRQVIESTLTPPDATEYGIRHVNVTLISDEEAGTPT